MVRISMLDAQIWVCKLKHKNILQFEYKDLPEELKNKATLHRARGEGLIISIGKNGHGRHLWRISDNIKCKEENDKINKENDGEKQTENDGEKQTENDGEKQTENEQSIGTKHTSEHTAS